MHLVVSVACSLYRYLLVNIFLWLTLWDLRCVFHFVFFRVFLIVIFKCALVMRARPVHRCCVCVCECVFDCGTFHLATCIRCCRRSHCNIIRRIGEEHIIKITSKYPYTLHVYSNISKEIKIILILKAIVCIQNTHIRRSEWPREDGEWERKLCKLLDCRCGSVVSLSVLLLNTIWMCALCSSTQSTK